MSDVCINKTDMGSILHITKLNSKFGGASDDVIGVLSKVISDYRETLKNAETVSLSDFRASLLQRLHDTGISFETIDDSMNVINSAIDRVVNSKGFQKE